MEPLENPLALDEGTLSSYLEKTDKFAIYTHSARTRLLVLGLFLSYAIFFFMFIGFLTDEIAEHRRMPQVFAMVEQGNAFGWVFYAVAGLAFLLTLAVFLYFLWAVVDIWGLQVWTSPLQLRVQNTIMGPVLPRLTGIGTIGMADIETVRGGKYFTHVSGGGRKIRFSPVNRLDALIATILANAGEVEIIE